MSPSMYRMKAVLFCTIDLFKVKPDWLNRFLPNTVVYSISESDMFKVRYCRDHIFEYESFDVSNCLKMKLLQFC